MKTTPKLAPGLDPDLYPKFRNANGTLTPYAFGCGYLETYGNRNGTPHASIQREPNDWHVKGFDRDGAHFWESFEKLADARRFARRTAGKLAIA